MLPQVMDPFVRKLVLRLLDQGSPLSRNRHFHTFETPEGKQALRLFKRLRALQHDLQKCQRAGGQSQVAVTKRPQGPIQIEITLTKLRSKRVATLNEEEFELLCRWPEVGELLTQANSKA